MNYGVSGEVVDLVNLVKPFLGESQGSGGSGGPVESDDSGEYFDTGDTADSVEFVYSVDLGEYG